MASKIAIQFVFKADQMRAICEAGQDILITSYIEEVTTQGGQVVGAMRVRAKSKPSKDETTSLKIASQDADGTIYGCPIPPCQESV